MRIPMLPKLSWVEAVKFIESRNAREKTMILSLTVVTLFFLDYWLLLRPVLSMHGQATVKLSMLQQEHRSLVSDKKNRAQIAESWKAAKAKLEATERNFVSAAEIPALLENLSKLAQESGVKLVSLVPSEPSEVMKTSYSRVGINLNAIAGTHELGKFLSRLETGTTFFRVADLKISDNSLDPRRHAVSLSVEVYRK